MSGSDLTFGLDCAFLSLLMMGTNCSMNIQPLAIRLTCQPFSILRKKKLF